MVSKEFFEALADLEAEKGISSEVFIEALRNALVSAYKKQYEGEVGEVDIRINPEKFSIKYYTVKTVAEEVVDGQGADGAELGAFKYGKVVHLGVSSLCLSLPPCYNGHGKGVINGSDLELVHVVSFCHLS